MSVWTDIASFASRKLRSRQGRAFLLLLLYLVVGVLFYKGVETKAKDCDEPPSSSSTTNATATVGVDELGDTGSGSGPSLTVQPQHLAANVNADASDDTSATANEANATPPATLLAPARLCTEPWSGADAMYFAVVTMSTVRRCRCCCCAAAERRLTSDLWPRHMFAELTIMHSQPRLDSTAHLWAPGLLSQVGYGDFSPSQWYSQLFTVAYALFGIVVVFSKLSAAVAAPLLPLFDWSRKQASRAQACSTLLAATSFTTRSASTHAEVMHPICL